MSGTSGKLRLGFVGLGIMGAPMAGHLLEAGHELVVWNRTAAKAQPLLDCGAAWADSPGEVALQRPAVVFVNVTDTPDVEAVLFGGHSVPAGIVEGAERGLVVVDHSTISPLATQHFAERLERGHGVTLLDAPVSGGDSGARAGTLSVMVGGPEEAFERVRPLLEIYGRSVVRVGPVGTGQACKACNQIAVAGALLGVAEAVSLARQTGLDPHVMLEVVGGGAGGSWQLSNLGLKMARGDFEPGFMIDYLRKDLGIVLDTAAEKKLSLRLAELARSLLDEASAQGHGKSGTQAVIRAMD